MSYFYSKVFSTFVMYLPNFTVYYLRVLISTKYLINCLTGYPLSSRQSSELGLRLQNVILLIPTSLTFYLFIFNWFHEFMNKCWFFLSFPFTAYAIVIPGSIVSTRTKSALFMLSFLSWIKPFEKKFRSGFDFDFFCLLIIRSWFFLFRLCN